MITFLDGILESKQPTAVTVNVGGVGYELHIPLSSFDRLPAPGAACRILTYDHVREDDHLLFGFMTEDERRMFVLLMSVSGIGPKLALSALSGLTVREIKAAIAGGDVKRLSSISGIGKKTAERIVVDLKDRIGVGEALAAAAPGRELSPGDARLRDAVLALISLGYKRVEAETMAQKALAAAGQDATVEAVVRKALST